MKPILRDSALADLDGIYAWLGKDNPAVAAFIVRKIFDGIDLLCFFPYIGHGRNIRDILEWSIPKLPYVIVYSVHEDFDEIVVHAVFHTSRDR